jgi:hypothetical protein
MTRRAIAIIAGCLFIAGGLFWGTEPAAAQGRAPVDVVHAMTHDVSPPLDKMPVIPPGGGPTVAIPLRRARPFQTSRATQQGSALQSSAPSPLSVSTGQNFLGVGNGLPGFTVQYIPPDTNGAAGDTQFVQWVNASFAVFNKSNGSKIFGPAAGNTLWSGMSGTAGRACSRNNSGDPIAQYDKQAGRWVMMQPVFKSPYYLCVAVSTTSDATGSWYRYAIPIPSGLFPDYPKLAVWNDAYYVTYNQFQGNSFLGAAACALDRTNMLLGNNATMQCFSVNSSYGALLPADLDGSSTPPSGSPEYLLNYDGNLHSLDLWQFHVDFGTPANSALSGPFNIQVDPFTEVCGGGTCIPQANTNQQLDSLGDRLMYRLAYRNFGDRESMVVAQSVDTGSGSGNTGIRWYELRETAPSTPSQSNWGLYQDGTYAPDTNYRWMPSVAQDKNGDIAMGYSVSSSGLSLTIRYTGRLSTDTLGQMEGENDILTGISTGSQTSYTRWGDYSSMALDPNDDCTFWHTNEYQPTNGNAWSTRIASFAFPGCSSGSTSVSVSSVTLSSYTVTGGNPVNGTVTLSAKAPSGGAVVTFTSSNQSVVPAPPDVTVAANATSQTFTVNTNSVTNSTTATITASYNGSSQTTPTLTVNPSTSGTLSLTPSSGSITVPAGGSSAYQISVTSVGFSPTVTLSVSGLPKFASGSFSPNPVTVSPSTPASSILTVKTNRHISPGGPYPLTITGTDSSGTITATATVSLTVQ